MFGIQISGLSVHQTYLDTTSNNIANTSTYGFKESRAEFGDVYGSTLYASTKTNTGLGAYTTTVAQQFTQGSLTGDTGNALDLAISGEGFFVLSSTNNVTGNETNVSDHTYTRNGAFEFDNEGYIVTATGEYLQFYSCDQEGNVTNLDLNSTHSLQVPSTTGEPQASSDISIGVNLPANSDYLGSVDETTGVVTHAMANFDPEDSSTYTASTSQTIHDSLGNAHTLTYYFLKDTQDETTNTTTWQVVCTVDGNPVDVQWDDADPELNANDFYVSDPTSSAVGTTYHGFTLTFDTNGQVTEDGINPAALIFTNEDTAYPAENGREAYTLAAAMGGGVSTDQSLVLDLSATQYGSSSFSVSQSPTDDGYATGELSSVEIDEDGLFLATYTNGQTLVLGKVALATFVNSQGLTQVGDTQWRASNASGEPTAREANVGIAGSIIGSNLEESNVELSDALVDLIVAQRGYQANCQALQTQNTVYDSIMNIR